MEKIEQSVEHLPVSEEVQRLLGSLGLYDALQDEYSTIEHPEDDKWVVRSTN